MTKGTFQTTRDYNSAIEALTDLCLDLDKRCPFAAPGARRDWLANEIKIALGDHGDIWPAEIYGACMIAGFEDAGKLRTAQ